MVKAGQYLLTCLFLILNISTTFATQTITSDSTKSVSLEKVSSDTLNVVILNKNESSFQRIFPTIIPAVISIIAIITTTFFSLKLIRRTAEEHRVSQIHSALYLLLSETTEIISEMIRLLEDVLRSIVHTVQGEVVESAHERYRNNYEELTKRFNSLLGKHEITLPKTLYETLLEIIKRMNSANSSAKWADPFSVENSGQLERLHMHQNDLQNEMKEVLLLYERFLNDSRGILGVDRLKVIEVSGLKLINNAKEAAEK